MDEKALRRVFIRANEFKQGDLQLGGTTDPVERKAARSTLARLRLGDIAKADLVEDAVTEALKSSVNHRIHHQIAHLTVGEMKRLILSSEGLPWIRQHMQGLTSEQIAAVVKLMTVEELSVVARSFFNPFSREGVAIGSEIHFGSRIQPNSPGDDETEILWRSASW